MSCRITVRPCLEAVYAILKASRKEQSSRNIHECVDGKTTGARAAQVVPHVHFHIIPRIGDVPEVKARSWTVFGKGQREDLDETDAEILITNMRKALGKEVERVRRDEGEGAVRMLLNDEAGTQRERSNL